MGRVLAMVFGCWLVLRLKRPFLRKVAIVSIPVTMASVYFTATRGPWIGFALVCLIFLVFKTPVRRTVRWLTVCIVIAAVFGLTHKFSIGENNLFLERQSHRDRPRGHLAIFRTDDRSKPAVRCWLWAIQREWPNYYKEFRGFDFTGFDGSHNTILTMAAEMGLPTLGIYLFLIFLFWRRCLRVYRQLDPGLTLERTFVVMVMGILLLYLITGWFSDLKCEHAPKYAHVLVFGRGSGD